MIGRSRVQCPARAAAKTRLQSQLSGLTRLGIRSTRVLQLGAATILVATNHVFCRDKHNFCRGKHTFVATKIIPVAAPANNTRRRPRSLCQKRGNTHTLLAQRIRSACGVDCRLYRHGIVWETIRETNSHANRPGMLVYSRVSSLLCVEIVGQKDRNCYS